MKTVKKSNKSGKGLSFKRKARAMLPICFAITKEDNALIAAVPRKSLDALAAGAGTSTDWYNVTFRLWVGTILAKKIYMPETVAGFAEVMEIALAMREYYLEHHSWTISAEIKEILLDGLDAVDTMHLECNRRDIYPAYKSALAHMKQFV